MARRGLTLTDPTTGQTITFEQTSADTGGELLAMETTYQPKAGKPPMHRHPTQAERFEVLEGELDVRLGRRRRRLTAGEVLEIPAGTPHAMSGSARARWEVRPALRTEQFLEAVCDPHAPATARVAAAHALPREFRLSGPAGFVMVLAGRLFSSRG